MSEILENIDMTALGGAGNEAETEKKLKAKEPHRPNRKTRRGNLRPGMTSAKIRNSFKHAPVVPIDQTPGANARRKAAERAAVDKAVRAAKARRKPVVVK